MAVVLAEPTCPKTSHWLRDPLSNEPVGELLNNSASCVAAPYDI
jgi:hypothetical protein